VAATLRLQGETGHAQSLHHGTPFLHFDLGAEVREGQANSVSTVLV
jgi:hypothetical protein